jgi:hypothetical protein
VKYAKMELEKHLYTFFARPVIGKRGGDGFLGAGLAKNKFCTDMNGLLSSKTTINPC